MTKRGTYNYPCFKAGCKYNCHDFPVLRKHLRAAHGQQSHTRQCPVDDCDFSGGVPSHYRSYHSLNHFDSCDQLGCTFYCYSPKKLAEHKKTVHNNDLHYVCGTLGCHFSTTNRDNLRTHRNGKHIKKLIPCEQPNCDFSTPYWTALYLHRKHQHPALHVRRYIERLDVTELCTQSEHAHEEMGEDVLPPAKKRKTTTNTHVHSNSMSA